MHANNRQDLSKVYACDIAGAVWLKDVVTGITLIGKGQDILKEVEMGSDDLYLESGYCISASGVVPVTVGEPTIKVRKILVGGTNEWK